MGVRTEAWSFISCDREGCKHEIERTQSKKGDWSDRNWGSIEGGGRLAGITGHAGMTLCDDCSNDLAAWLRGAQFAPLNGTATESEAGVKLSDDAVFEAAVAGRVRWVVHPHPDGTGANPAGTAALDQRDHALNRGGPAKGEV